MRDAVARIEILNDSDIRATVARNKETTMTIEALADIIRGTNTIGATITCSVYDGRASRVLVQTSEANLRHLAGELGAEVGTKEHRGIGWHEATANLEGVTVEVVGPRFRVDQGAP